VIVLAVVVVGALVLFYAIGRTSQRADDDADEMYQQMITQQQDQQAMERITRR
jgi:type II secretory pathway pseudopilin PulG